MKSGMRNCLLVVLLAMALCAPARADTIINFDELPQYAPVTDQYQDLGVTFGTDAVDALVNIIVTNGSIAVSQPNILAAAFDMSDGVISFSFAPAVLSVSFTAVSVENGVTVEYFDDQGATSGTVGVGPTGDYFAQVEFSYTNPQLIGSVLITAEEMLGPDPFGIDDLSFVVPEPATLGLLVIGAIVIRRRRPRR